ncbi:transcription factor bHLH95 [Humulus lupulus]|uniref:transcription factor bHLH95 n=1 Tax=Humulus lupulus TaxID=3486 RepID=UPI002B41376D|nr:transcription factor bHLH95 [Humulus lupulus]
MSQGGTVLLMGTETSFLQWDEKHTWLLPNTFSNSDNYSSGVAAAAADESCEKNKIAASNSDSGGGHKAMPVKELGLLSNNNKKRSRGTNVGVCNNKKGKKTSTTTTEDDQPVKEGKGNGDGSVSGSGSGGGESDHEIHIWTERERRKKMRNMFANLHALLPQLPPKADKSTIVDEAVNYIRNLQQTLHKLQKQKLEKLQAGATNNLANTFTNNIGEPSINNITNNPQPKLVYDSREAYLADQGTCNELVSIGNNNNNNNTNSLLPVLFQTWTSSNVVLNICGEEAHISVCSPKKPGLFTSICYVLEKHKISIISAQLSSDSNRIMYMIHAHQASSTGVGSDQFVEAFSSVEEVFKQAVGELMLWVSS